MNSMKTKAGVGLGALALAALALPIIAAPASASLTDGNFLIRSVSGNTEKTFEAIRGLNAPARVATEARIPEVATEAISPTPLP